MRVLIKDSHRRECVVEVSSMYYDAPEWELVFESITGHQYCTKMEERDAKRAIVVLFNMGACQVIDWVTVRD